VGFIQSIIRKLKTFGWFLKNPQYISHIPQILKRGNHAKLENSRDEATEWCSQVALSSNEVMSKLTGNDEQKDLRILFPEIFNYADEQVRNCPVTMGGEGASSFLYHITKKVNAKKIIETGVAYGWSSLAILLAIKDEPGAKLISNDMPYIKLNNDDYVGCVIPDDLKIKWELQRLPDISGIPMAIKKFNGNIDLCHYDSDKSYTGRMFAYPLLWKALEKNGIFISDDIQDNIAFNQFAETVEHEPLVFEYRGKYVGVIIKQ
jgi:hypothetical protein